jgi:esterase/lipase superfamily enzyme
LFIYSGDLFLAAFKANSRNAALLEEYLRIRGEEYLKLRDAIAETSSSAVKGKEKENSEEIDKAAKKSGVKTSDIDQVKPGAGLEAGELIPSPELIPGDYPGEATTAPAKITKSPNGSKRQGFLDSWRKRNGGEKSSPVKDTGKFIEHVNSDGNNSVVPKA